MKLPLSSQVRPTGVTLAGCCNLLLSFFPRQEDLTVSEAWSGMERPHVPFTLVRRKTRSPSGWIGTGPFMAAIRPFGPLALPFPERQPPGSQAFLQEVPAGPPNSGLFPHPET